MSRPWAIVTGASRGIGKAIAIALAESGFDLILSARTVHSGEVRDNTLSIHRSERRALPGSLDETAEIVRSWGAAALVIPMDLTDRYSVGAFTQQVLDSGAAVDLIVHNGRYLGPGMMDTFMDTPIDALGKFVAAHAIAPLLITRALLPQMLERGRGKIFMITSNAAYEVPPAPAGRGGWGLAYATGKAAGHQLVGTLHAEFGGQGIVAINIQPGFVGTERNLEMLRDYGADPSRAAPPSVIGSVVAWLSTASGAAEFGGRNVEAQELCLARKLHPDWRS